MEPGSWWWIATAAGILSSAAATAWIAGQLPREAAYLRDHPAERDRRLKWCERRDLALTALGCVLAVLAVALAQSSLRVRGARDMDLVAALTWTLPFAEGAFAWARAKRRTAVFFVEGPSAAAPARALETFAARMPTAAVVAAGTAALWSGWFGTGPEAGWRAAGAAVVAGLAATVLGRLLVVAYARAGVVREEPDPEMSHAASGAEGAKLHVAVLRTSAAGHGTLSVARDAGGFTVRVTDDLRRSITPSELRALALRKQTGRRAAARGRDVAVMLLEVAAPPVIVLGLLGLGPIALAIFAWTFGWAGSILRLRGILTDDRFAARTAGPAMPLATALMKVMTVRGLDPVEGGLRMPPLPSRWLAMGLGAPEVVATLRAQDQRPASAAP